MLQLTDQSRYLLYNGNVDMRKSFQGLAAMVKKQMKCNVQNGDVYVFLNKRRNSIKLLRFEGDGFAIFYKHLEQGTFEMPLYQQHNNSILVSDQELLLILRGVALRKLKYRPRYTQQNTIAC
jgi:transposase